MNLTVATGSEAAALWDLRPDTTYLNHGSFGPSPREVMAAYRDWQDRLNEQPMDFFVRQLHDHVQEVRSALADWLGGRSEQLLLVDNATYGMNIVARSHPLQAGDNVVLNQHEYGAVERIWQRRCQEVGAEVRIAQLPHPLPDHDAVVEAVMSVTDERTRLIVASHITSATALVLPIAQLCAAAATADIPVCVDGPHAPAQIPVDLAELGCAYYTASCHKWLCAPFR